MYVCNTKNGDVRKAIKNMKDSNSPEEIRSFVARNDARRFPMILQVSMAKYRQLKNTTSQERMTAEARRKDAKHFINHNTLTLHKKNCYYIADHFLKAVIIRPKLTGLHLCKHCMG